MSGGFTSVIPDDGYHPQDIDISVAHQARVYDYLLGGKDHFAADREVGERIREANPELVIVNRANRAFLGRAVRFLAAEAGIRQFLDIGTGIPSADNTHEVAQSVAPESRIVYVDNDRSKPGCSHACQAGQDACDPAGIAVPEQPPRVTCLAVGMAGGQLDRASPLQWGLQATPNRRFSPVGPHHQDPVAK